MLEGSRWPVSTCWLTSPASSLRVRGDSRGRRARRPRGPRGEASALAGTWGSDTTRAGRTPFLRGESVFPGASPAAGGTNVSRSSRRVRAACPGPPHPGRSLSPGLAGPGHRGLRRPGEGWEPFARAPGPLACARRQPCPSELPECEGKEAAGRAGEDSSAMSNLLVGDSPGAAPGKARSLSFLSSLPDSGSSAFTPGAAAGGDTLSPDGPCWLETRQGSCRPPQRGVSRLSRCGSAPSPTAQSSAVPAAGRTRSLRGRGGESCRPPAELPMDNQDNPSPGAAGFSRGRTGPAAPSLARCHRPLSDHKPGPPPRTLTLLCGDSSDRGARKAHLLQDTPSPLSSR